MKINSILFTALMLGTLSVSAQGLHQEIDVEREIVPIERDATRINTLPAIVLPPVTPVQLSFSDRVVTAQVPNHASPLDPTAYGDTLGGYPYCGYADLGIFPLYNVDFSAGYRIVNNSRTRLGLWAQYDGRIYRKDRGESFSTSYWRDHSATAGLNLYQAIGGSSSLDGRLAYTWASHTISGLNVISAVPESYHYQLGVSRLDFDLGFSSRCEGLAYRVGARFNHFGYNPGKMDGKGASQNRFGLDFAGLLRVGESSRLKLDVDADVLATSGVSAKNSGLVSLIPAYIYDGKNFEARLGARLGIVFNDGKVFRISPDVSLGWHPGSHFAIGLTATGGTVMNSLASLYDVTPYCNPFAAYSSSDIPYDINGTITIGPFYGAWLKLKGGYARANNWLMPCMNDEIGGGQLFAPVDVKAWHYGVSIGYDYSDVVSLRLDYETTPGKDLENAYYMWRDRARHVFLASAAIRPISGLEINAGMEWRIDRRVSRIMTLEDYSNSVIELGNVSNLTLGVSYAFTRSFTVFLHGENLLNHRHIILGDRINQGITGLVGVTVKF